MMVKMLSIQLMTAMGVTPHAKLKTLMFAQENPQSV
jgi:hypothetical protein